jgi:hypothetical protein
MELRDAIELLGLGEVEGVMILCSDFPFIFLGYFSEAFCGEDVC